MLSIDTMCLIKCWQDFLVRNSHFIRKRANIDVIIEFVSNLYDAVLVLVIPVMAG